MEIGVGTMQKYFAERAQFGIEEKIRRVTIVKETPKQTVYMHGSWKCTSRYPTDFCERVDEAYDILIERWENEIKKREEHVVDAKAALERVKKNKAKGVVERER